MNVSVGAGIKNRFTFVVEDIETKEKREYTAHNIVLDTMWSRLVNFQPFFVNIHFGTGTGTFDDPTRTSLYTHLGTKAATTEFQTRDLPTSQWRRKIVLNPEEFVGQTITEVGVAYGSSAANLVTHAAPKDAEGNPISIGPKKDTEIITIYADMYFVLAENMYGGKIKWVTPLENNELLSYLMGGTYPTQQFRVTKARQGESTALTSHGQSANILVADWVKDIPNKKATTPVTRLGTTIGNGEVQGFGIGSSDLNGTFRGQFPIGGVREPFNIVGELIGEGDGVNTGFNFANNFPVENSSTIYVDGIPEPNYNINILKKDQYLDYSFITNPLEQITSNQASGDPKSAMDGTTTTGYSVTSPQYPLILQLDLLENKDWGIKQIRIFMAAGYINNTSVQISEDGQSWNNIATGIFAGASWTTTDIAQTVTNFRYIRINAGRGSTPSIGEIQFLIGKDQIQFLTPPPAGSTITADYTLDYIPKDTNHVLDLQAAIQFGEVI